MSSACNAGPFRHEDARSERRLPATSGKRPRPDFFDRAQAAVGITGGGRSGLTGRPTRDQVAKATPRRRPADRRWSATAASGRIDTATLAPQCNATAAGAAWGCATISVWIIRGQCGLSSSPPAAAESGARASDKMMITIRSKNFSKRNAETRSASATQSSHEALSDDTWYCTRQTTSLILIKWRTRGSSPIQSGCLCVRMACFRDFDTRRYRDPGPPLRGTGPTKLSSNRRRAKCNRTPVSRRLRPSVAATASGDWPSPSTRRKISAATGGKVAATRQMQSCNRHSNSSRSIWSRASLGRDCCGWLHRHIIFLSPPDPRPVDRRCAQPRQADSQTRAASGHFTTGAKIRLQVAFCQVAKRAGCRNNPETRQSDNSCNSR